MVQFCGILASPDAGSAADRVDFTEASGLGRAGLSAIESALSGTINPDTLAFHAPVRDGHLRVEFYG